MSMMNGNPLDMSYEDRKGMQERLVEQLRKDKAKLEDDISERETALASNEQGDKLRTAFETAKANFDASEKAVKVAVSSEAIWKANAGLVEAQKALSAADSALREYSSSRDRSNDILLDERKRLAEVVADLAAAEENLAAMVAEHDAIEAEHKAQAEAQARRDAVTARRAAAAPCLCCDCAAWASENEAGMGVCHRKSGERPQHAWNEWCLEGIPEQTPAEVGG